MRMVGASPDTNVILLSSIVISTASPLRSAVTSLRSVPSAAVSTSVAPGSSSLSVASFLLIESCGFCSSIYSASHTLIVFFALSSS